MVSDMAIRHNCFRMIHHSLNFKPKLQTKTLNPNNYDTP